MFKKSDLQSLMKDAMRARDSVRLGVIRFLLAEIRNWEIDNGDADEAAITTIVKRQVKQLKEGIAEFESADRAETVKEETAKLAILESFLPTQLSDEALSKIVATAIAAESDLSMGPVMKRVIAAVAGQADGGRVSAEVKRQLSA